MGVVALSLFNGMSTGHQAFVNLGVKVDKYYSSEIKKAAIKLTGHHFPDTIELGSICNWKSWDIDFSKIDIVLSGSPCKDLSGAGKRAGIYGDNSGLFWYFIDILNHIKTLNPNVVFLQENVGSASKLDIGIMSRALGVYPCRINSSLVTAQLRDRYYWTNIKTRQSMFDIVTDIPQPKNRNITFSDVIENGFVFKEKSKALLMSESKSWAYVDMKKFKNQFIKQYVRGSMTPNVVYSFVDREKARAILESESRPLSDKEKLFRRYRNTGFGNIIYELKNDVLDVRILTKIEMCRLQGFPDDYCNILKRNEAASLLGDGWTLPIIEHILSFWDRVK